MVARVSILIGPISLNGYDADPVVQGDEDGVDAARIDLEQVDVETIGRLRSADHFDRDPEALGGRLQVELEPVSLDVGGDVLVALEVLDLVLAAERLRLFEAAGLCLSGPGLGPEEEGLLL